MNLLLLGVPTSTKDINNEGPSAAIAGICAIDEQYITKSVSKLDNYYIKSQVDNNIKTADDILSGKIMTDVKDLPVSTFDNDPPYATLADLDTAFGKVQSAQAQHVVYHIGAIFAYPGSVIPAGCEILNGKVLTNCEEDYSAFCTWIRKSKVRRVSLATWNAEFNKTGSCGAFVVTNTAGTELIGSSALADSTKISTIKLPAIGDGAVYGINHSSTNQIGLTVEQSLPNITRSNWRYW